MRPLILAAALAVADDWRAAHPHLVFGAATGEHDQSAEHRGRFGTCLRGCMGVESVEVRVAGDHSAIIDPLRLRFLRDAPDGSSRADGGADLDTRKNPVI